MVNIILNVIINVTYFFSLSLFSLMYRKAYVLTKVGLVYCFWSGVSHQQSAVNDWIL